MSYNLQVFPKNRNPFDKIADNQYRQLIGCPGASRLIIYAVYHPRANGPKIDRLAVHHPKLASKYRHAVELADGQKCLLSFEADGILVLGIDRDYYFSGRNAFISKAAVNHIIVNSSPIYSNLVMFHVGDRAQCTMEVPQHMGLSNQQYAYQHLRDVFAFRIAPKVSEPDDLEVTASATAPASTYVYCYHCGHRIPADSQFCHYCGAKQGSTSQVNSSSPFFYDLQVHRFLTTNADNDRVVNKYKRLMGFSDSTKAIEHGMLLKNYHECAISFEPQGLLVIEINEHSSRDYDFYTFAGKNHFIQKNQIHDVRIVWHYFSADLYINNQKYVRVASLWTKRDKANFELKVQDLKD